MSNEGKPGEVLHAVFGWINETQHEYIRKLEKENGAGNGGSLSHEQYLRMRSPYACEINYNSGAQHVGSGTSGAASNRPGQATVDRTQKFNVQISDYKSPFVSPSDPLASLSSDQKIADLQSEMNDLNERITYLKELSNYKIDKVKHVLGFWLIITVISLVAFFGLYTIVT